MRFPWQASPEQREQAFTDALLAGAQTIALQTSGSALASSVATVEACVRWWSRAISSATVSPENHPVTEALNPVMLSQIARSLALVGEFVGLIEVDTGVSFLPATSWKISGGTRPATWVYELVREGPGDRKTTRRVRRDAVLHLTYATVPGRPWQGCSPLTSSSLSAATLGKIERSLNQDAGIPGCRRSGNMSA